MNFLFGVQFYEYERCSKKYMLIIYILTFSFYLLVKRKLNNIPNKIGKIINPNIYNNIYSNFEILSDFVSFIDSRLLQMNKYNTKNE